MSNEGFIDSPYFLFYIGFLYGFVFSSREKLKDLREKSEKAFETIKELIKKGAEKDTNRKQAKFLVSLFDV